MSNDARDMEILLDNVRRPGRAQAVPEQAIPEFDAFFEKLSNLDDLTLMGDPDPELLTGGITHKPVKVRPDDPVKGGIHPVQKRKMQMMRSDFIQNGGKGSSRRGKSAQPRNGAGTGIPMGLITFFKLATAAALLFGVGLGSGYVALSLPFKSDDGFSRMQEEQIADEAIVTGGNIVTGENGERGGIGAGNERDVPSFSQINTAVNRKGASPVEAGDGRRYAIQVGACNSPACVSEYRKLLMAHVSSNVIQVIERNAGNSQSLVQRIRVVSLNANDAKKLKADLAAADARFKDAYVVSLPRSPSS